MGFLSTEGAGNNAFKSAPHSVTDNWSWGSSARAIAQSRSWALPRGLLLLLHVHDHSDSHQDGLKFKDRATALYSVKCNRLSFSSEGYRAHPTFLDLKKKQH